MAKHKNKNNELVTRNYSIELRTAENEDNIIEGVPIVFEKPTRIRDWSGEFDEIIDRHALDSADLRDVCLFVNHSTDKIPLARTKNGNGTMSLSIQDDGVHIRAVLDTENNTEAMSAYSAVKRGDIQGMSFTFRVKSQEWINLDSDVPTRRIKEISIVHEVSIVNFPAYPQTSVNARANGGETPYSPLEEAREAKAKEIAQRDLDLLKEKNKILGVI